MKITFLLINSVGLFLRSCRSVHNIGLIEESMCADTKTSEELSNVDAYTKCYTNLRN